MKEMGRAATQLGATCCRLWILPALPPPAAALGFTLSCLLPGSLPETVWLENFNPSHFPL